MSKECDGCKCPERGDSDCEFGCLDCSYRGYSRGGDNCGFREKTEEQLFNADKVRRQNEEVFRYWNNEISLEQVKFNQRCIEKEKFGDTSINK